MTDQRETGSLDPDDWDSFRALCHRAVDDMVDCWASARERPVWQPIPEAAKAALAAVPPRDGQSADAVYDAFRAHILPHLLGNTHPRFWGWVHGSGTPLGALAEFLAGSVNANLGGREHMPVMSSGRSSISARLSSAFPLQPAACSSAVPRWRRCSVSPWPVGKAIPRRCAAGVSPPTGRDWSATARPRATTRRTRPSSF